LDDSLSILIEDQHADSQFGDDELAEPVR